MKASGTLGRTRHRRRSGTLARRLFFMQLALIAVVCVALSITSYVSTLGSARQATSERVLSIAETLAHDPFVISSVEDADATAQLQPYALTVIDTAEVDFVTIMDRDRTRYTHPDPKQLGKHYIGSIDQALHGQGPVTLGGYLASPDFWNRTLQNWQSEFLAVGAMIAFSIFLRQRGSSESKPVGAPHYESAEGAQ
ncbi:MAG: hypothetical protein L0G54_16905 [Brevibacterium sp.]|nr:hypothetical protein [Brevibacterium sp.]